MGHYPMMEQLEALAQIALIFLNGKRLYETRFNVLLAFSQ